MKRLSLAAAASMLGLTLAMPPMTDVHAAELKVIAGGSLVVLPTVAGFIFALYLALAEALR